MARYKGLFGILLALVQFTSAQAFELKVEFKDQGGFSVAPDSIAVAITNAKGFRIAAFDTTREASVNLVFSGVPGDFSITDRPEDSRVEFADFVLFVSAWGKPASLGSVFDINGDGEVNFADFFVFANHFGVRASDPEFVPRELPVTVLSRTITNGVVDTVRISATIGFGGEPAVLTGSVKTDDVYAREFRLALRDSAGTRINEGDTLNVVRGDTTHIAGVSSLYRNGLLARQDTVAAALFSPDSAVVADSLVAFGPMFAVADTAGVFRIAAAYDTFTVSFYLAVVIPDTTAPALESLTFNADSTLITGLKVKGEKAFTTVRLNGAFLTIRLATEVPWDRFLISDITGSVARLDLRDGDNTLVVVLADSLGNMDSVSVLISRPDRTGPALGIRDVVWGGEQRNILSFIFVMSDSMSVVMGYGVFVPDANYDLSGVASRKSYEQNVPNAAFPTVNQPTRREIRLRARDSARNLSEKSVFVEQPVSLAPPPPPPPPPPPATVAASINSATVNGKAAGQTVGPVPFGSTLTLVASVSGSPTPSVTWSLAGSSASGTNTSIAAKSGTITLTVNNSVGSPQTLTWSVVTLGAP